MNPPPPPTPTRVAVILLAASFGLGLGGVLVADAGFITLSYGIGLAVTLALAGSALLGLWRGWNWMRWLIAVFVSFGIVMLPWYLPEILTTWEQIIYLVQGALQVAAVVLLFVRSSRNWFQPDRSVKPSPPQGTA